MREVNVFFVNIILCMGIIVGIEDIENHRGYRKSTKDEQTVNDRMQQ
jgi:hypothetical protein